MTWCERETDWLLAGRHVYFAPEDERAIAAFERHLQARQLRFVVHNRREVPAIVFAPSRAAPRAGRRLLRPAGLLGRVAIDEQADHRSA